ncbi:MAG: TonB-dependent receptor [Bacteroidetes bacterium]|nr:TonB-dependent receptor [Bacteroidota bacterium]
MKKTTLLFFLFLFLTSTFQLAAQTHVVKGVVTDSTGNKKIFGATVILFHPHDSLAVAGAMTDSLGKFSIGGLADGPYRVKILAPGYSPGRKFAMVQSADIDLGNIFLKNDGVILDETQIKEIQTRVTQSGDTTMFNASAYKTNPDATAEDLLNKMPGVTNDGSGPKVHGEDVKQVLVDGKPFFGDDPNAALKNVPADMVDQVQVYDASSEQSRLTGFDDGNSKKTVNIITKKGGMNGTFGKIYAGYGTNSRYNSGVTMNYFNHNRRLTFIGMSNDINQQNFNTQDLFGLLGGGGGMKMMMGGKGGSGGNHGGGSSGNFMVGQQGGISTTHAFGTNYSDMWGPKIKVSGSYFFNYSSNFNNTKLTRNYFTTNDSTLIYNDTSSAYTRNVNHRFNFRFEYNIDSMDVLVINPRFTSQFTDYNKTDNGVNVLAEVINQSMTNTRNASDNLGFTFTNNITYRHRFAKQGRSITFDVGNSLNQRNGTGIYYTRNIYFPNDTTVLDQHSSLNSLSTSYTPSLSWTEPFRKKGQFLFTLTPSITKNDLQKETNDHNPNNELYDMLDSALSNKYKSTYTTGRSGVAYRYAGEKLTVIIGSDYQYANLESDQTYPVSGMVTSNYQNILPNANINYKFNKTTNWKVIYRTSTVAPTISQLQNVVDNSNPLQLKSGNPKLTQDYEHTFISHYGKTNSDKGTGFFIFFYGGITEHYIGNSTTIASRDTTVNGVFLNRGSQLTLPVNLEGYKNGRMFVNYAVPLTKLKMNLGFNVSTGFTRTPGMINGRMNLADNFNVGPGLTLSSNISEDVDFTIMYNGSYNIINNSLPSQAGSNSDYFTHTVSARMNLIFFKRLVVNTSLDQNFYSGLGSGYNSNFLLWNAYVGYKFLKDKSLEAKISSFDLLKQNLSVTRSVTESYVEDSRTNVLSQYFMFTITWNVRKMQMPADAGGAGQGDSHGDGHWGK